MAIARPACRPSVMHVNTIVAPRSSDVVRALQSRPNASVKTRSPPEGRRSFCLSDNLGIEGPRFIIACPPAPASSRGANRTQRITDLEKKRAAHFAPPVTYEFASIRGSGRCTLSISDCSALLAEPAASRRLHTFHRDSAGLPGKRCSPRGHSSGPAVACLRVADHVKKSTTPFRETVDQYVPA